MVTWQRQNKDKRMERPLLILAIYTTFLAPMYKKENETMSSFSYNFPQFEFTDELIRISYDQYFATHLFPPV